MSDGRYERALARLTTEHDREIFIMLVETLTQGEKSIADALKEHNVAEDEPGAVEFWRYFELYLSEQPDQLLEGAAEEVIAKME